MSTEPEFSQNELDKAVIIALLKQKVESLETHQELQDNEIKSLKKDRDNALRWGILVLGSAVVSMGAWIFNLLTSKIPA